MIIKTIILFAALFSVTFALGHSVSWNKGSIVILYAILGLSYITPVLFAMFLAYIIPKVLRKTPSGIFKYFIIRTILILVTLVIISYITMLLYLKLTPSKFTGPDYTSSNRSVIINKPSTPLTLLKPQNTKKEEICPDDPLVSSVFDRNGPVCKRIREERRLNNK